jgi:hypothetical protein
VRPSLTLGFAFADFSGPYFYYRVNVGGLNNCRRCRGDMGARLHNVQSSPRLYVLSRNLHLGFIKAVETSRKVYFNHDGSILTESV